MANSSRTAWKRAWIIPALFLLPASIRGGTQKRIPQPRTRFPGSVLAQFINTLYGSREKFLATSGPSNLANTASAALPNWTDLELLTCKTVWRIPQLTTQQYQQASAHRPSGSARRELTRRRSAARQPTEGLGRHRFPNPQGCRRTARLGTQLGIDTTSLAVVAGSVSCEPGDGDDPPTLFNTPSALHENF